MNALVPYTAFGQAPALRPRPGFALRRPPARLALDRAASQRSYTEDGHLRIASTVLTRAERSPYRGSEIPDYQALGLDPDRTYWLLRDPDALRQAVKTFEQIPCLISHRPLSSVDHPYELVVGATGTDARFDGTDLTNSLVIWAEPAIRAIESGERRDISCGYRYVPVMSPGVFRGKRYDGVMTEIIAQHAALVPEGRVNGAYVADQMPAPWRRQRPWR
jgi:hypothetical protein